MGSSRKKPSEESSQVASTAGNVVQLPGVSLDSILGGDFSGEGSSAVEVRAKAGTTNARLREEAGTLADQVEKMDGMSPEERIATRTRILQASIESARNALPEDRKSLGALVASLNSSFADIGEEFARVQDFTPDEQRIIDKAQQAYKAALNHVEEAKEGLQSAGKRWKWFGRDSAVATATKHLSDAEQAVSLANSEIDKATKVAEDVRSNRLQTADFEQSFQTINVCVKQTVQVLMDRIKALNLQTEEAESKKMQSYENKKTAAANMEKRQVDVERLAAEYSQAVEVRDSLEVGSSGRVEAEAKVSSLQRSYEEAKASHDQQMVIFQSMEKATTKLGIDESSLRAGLHAHKVTLAQLVADSDVWLVEFRNRVAQIKAMASQQASSDLIQLGSAVRLANAKSSAEFAIGSLANITEQAERHPAQMADLGTIATAMAEGLQSAAARWKVIEDKTKGVGVSEGLGD